MADNLSVLSDRLTLEYEPMDAIHREFMALCAALAAADDAAYLERLDALIAHTVLHFAQEDDWMQAHAFPSAGCHRREHDTVLEVMREVRGCVLQGDTEVGVRLAQELPNWFAHHVDTMDAALAEFLTDADAASAAALPQLQQ
ncbi:hemerythrin domain-containing protein [Herminiimonas sp. CN]|uniref:hemerythrin domain-containing protein n=1 Tax=Herminiimonas sp. CN TaxID=1349818 RepID=UPI000684FE9A|nr:hemerythrin domain-containing protein [Herminiimonas sp. CN]